MQRQRRANKDSTNPVLILTDLQGLCQVGRGQGGKAAIGDDGLVFVGWDLVPALDSAQGAGASLFDIPGLLCGGCGDCADCPGIISTRNATKLV